MSKSDPTSTTGTLGARLDAILAPFAADEQRLQDAIAELEAKVAKLHIEIEGSQTDLSVVQSSKIECLREAAKSDPLLSVAFAGLAAAETADQYDAAAAVSDTVEDLPKEGGHSLLQM